MTVNIRNPDLSSSTRFRANNLGTGSGCKILCYSQSPTLWFRETIDPLNPPSIRRADPDIEIVTTSGYGKNGALCVLQRSVRPQVVTTFELPGCLDMWTVVGDGGGGGGADGGPADGHSFLILSRWVVRSENLVCQLMSAFIRPRRDKGGRGA